LSAEQSQTGSASGARSLSRTCILTFAYFMLGSIGSAWLAPLRDHVPLVTFVAFILILPALGVALVKPCSGRDHGARFQGPNVRSVGYSIYYTLVNVGSTAGPLLASWAQAHRR
jgi:dipeptide/tripeptide permease